MVSVEAKTPCGYTLRLVGSAFTSKTLRRVVHKKTWAFKHISSADAVSGGDFFFFFFFSEVPVCVQHVINSPRSGRFSGVGLHYRRSIWPLCTRTRGSLVNDVFWDRKRRFWMDCKKSAKNLSCKAFWTELSFGTTNETTDAKTKVSSSFVFRTA